MLGPRRWQTLRDFGVTRTFRRGEYLLRQGDRGGFVLALTQGRVQVTALGPDGRQLLQAVRGPGDLLGELSLAPEARRTASVIALDPGAAWCVPASRFRRFLDTEHAHGALRDYLIAKLSETVPYQLQLVHFTPRQRIARLLLDVITLAGDHPQAMWIPFSQTAVAAALGLARSTVAEQIGILRERGVLAPGPRLVVTDIQRLREEAGIGGDPPP